MLGSGGTEYSALPHRAAWAAAGKGGRMFVFHLGQPPLLARVSKTQNTVIQACGREATRMTANLEQSDLERRLALRNTYSAFAMLGAALFYL